MDFASGAVIKGSVQYRIEENDTLDWATIHRNDLVLQRVMAQPNRPIAFHSPTLFAARERTIVRDYANRYAHQNGLVMLVHDTVTGFAEGLSFYRARKEAHFGSREQRRMRILMPHLQEALKLDRQLAADSATAPTQGALLITSLDGSVQHCERQAREWMRLEWHDWRGTQLPVPLLATLGRPGVTAHIGKRIAVGCSRINTLLFLRIKPCSPLARLTPRERGVAGLYGKGTAGESHRHPAGYRSRDGAQPAAEQLPETRRARQGMPGQPAGRPPSLNAMHCQGLMRIDAELCRILGGQRARRLLL